MSVLVVLGELFLRFSFAPVSYFFFYSPHHTVIPRKKERECQVLKSTCFPAGLFLVNVSIKTHWMNLHHNYLCFCFFFLLFISCYRCCDSPVWMVSTLFLNSNKLCPHPLKTCQQTELPEWFTGRKPSKAFFTAWSLSLPEFIVIS